MEGTDIHTGYQDGTAAHDHSYYGNGCDNPTDTSKPFDGGSTVSCTTRVTQTYDGDSQKNGTYMNFQAATSGSGAPISTDNANSPDSFCPLGWQMPYSGSGGDYYDKSKSWKYLFTIYNYNKTQSGLNSIRSYPLSFIYSGSYNYYRGVLFNFSRSGQYYSMTNGSGINETYRLGIWNYDYIVNNIDGKTPGYIVRCVSELAT